MNACKCGSTSCAALTPGVTTMPTPFGTWHRPAEHACWCCLCNPGAWWMVTCGLCGSKRCPKAVWHKQPCDCHESNPPTEGDAA